MQEKWKKKMKTSAVKNLDIKPIDTGENINSHGFGMVDKAVITTCSIKLPVKGLYAYLCSYADSNGISYPSVSKILNDLHICRNTFYRYLKQLTTSGIITVEHERSGGKYSRSVYRISGAGKRGSGRSGYGKVPKSVMTSALPLEAKGLYAYYCAFAGAGESAYPKQEHILYHLEIEASTLQSYNRELVDNGYITVSQRHVNGRLDRNEIKLLQHQSIPESKEEQNNRYNSNITVIKVSEISCNSALGQDSKICDTAKQYTVEQYTAKCDTKKTVPHKKTASTSGRKNTNQTAHTRRAGDLRPSGSKTEYSVNDEYKASRQISQNRHIPAAWLDNKSLCLASVDYLLEYKRMNRPDGWENKSALAMYQNFVAGLKSLLTSEESVLNGEYVSADDILEKLNSFLSAGSDISLWDIQNIAENYYLDSAVKYEIRNPAAYMRSCIWTAMNNAEFKLQQLYSA